jgi:hypothetical protein
MEMDFYRTTQEPGGQMKATEGVIITLQTMIQTIICPTLTTVELFLYVQLSHYVLLRKRMHHGCPEKPPSTINISAAKISLPAELRP